MGCSGIKPNIQHIRDLTVIRSIVTKQFARFEIKPSINPALFNFYRDFFKQCFCLSVQLTRLFMHEYSDWDTPVTLP